MFVGVFCVFSDASVGVDCCVVLFVLLIGGVVLCVLLVVLGGCVVWVLCCWVGCLVVCVLGGVWCVVCGGLCVVWCVLCVVCCVLCVACSLDSAFQGISREFCSRLPMCWDANVKPTNKIVKKVHNNFDKTI